MAVTAVFYGTGLTSLFNGEVDYDTDAIKVMLCTSTYTPNVDTHRYKSSVTNEVTGTGYTAGGATLASKTVSYDAPTNTLTLDAADVSWTGSTITARYAVIYKSTGTNSTSPLLVLIDFGADIASSAGPLLIEWSATGIITAVAS
jgi:hypothetical protein